MNAKQPLPNPLFVVEGDFIDLTKAKEGIYIVLPFISLIISLHFAPMPA